MDEEFNLESTKGKKKARMGRRANEEEDSAGGTTADGGAAPKRRGGWGDEPPRTAGSGGRRADDELGERCRYTGVEGGSACCVISKRTARDGKGAEDNEIDLKLLTRCLAADQDLQEPDEYWDWDRLFAEVTGDLLVDTGDQDVGPVAPPTAASGSASDEATATAVPVK
uniref:Intraflagellar transport protein 43 homolog n=1 Tax=Macrostomum lignano TaxID=282301 RepID=A0A1I8IWS8_9PLAT